MASIVSKDTSGRLVAQAGETEVTGWRTRTGRTFHIQDLPGGRWQRRVVATTGPIHYRAPFTSDAWQEIDIDIAATPSDPWDYGAAGNSWQFMAWQSRAGLRYVGRFGRAGHALTMAPIGLWWVNAAGDRQLIGRPTASITPAVDNARNEIVWPDCFGSGLDFGYSLRRVTGLYKFLVINAKTDLPVPTISGPGIRLALVMALGWDVGAAPSGFAEGIDASAVPSAEDWTAPDEELTDTDVAFAEARGFLWRLGRPRAWDSADAQHNVPLAWRVQRRGNRIYGAVLVQASDLNNPAVVYPVTVDTVVNEQAPSGADDAYAILNVSGFGNGDTWGNIGARGGNTYHVWARFTTVAVPAGATIDSAYASYRSHDTESGDTVNLRFRGQDEDDASQLADWAAYAAVNWTTATVDWDALPTWSAGTWYGGSGPDIKTIIQEIVDRGGWATGQAMGIDLGENSSTNSEWREYYTYDNSSSDAPKLDITYTAGGTTHSGALTIAAAGGTTIAATMTYEGDVTVAAAGGTTIAASMLYAGGVTVAAAGGTTIAAGMLYAGAVTVAAAATTSIAGALVATGYYPNDTNCGGYQGTPLDYDALPGTLANWTGATPLSGAEKDDLSDDNVDTVTVSNVGPSPFNAGGVLAEYTLTHVPTRLDIAVQMEDNGGEGAKVWIYDHVGGSFTLKGTHAGGAPGAYTFSFSITSSATDYVSGGNLVHVLVANTNDDGTDCEVADMLLTVTGGELELGALTIAGAGGTAIAASMLYAGEVTIAGVATTTIAGQVGVVVGTITIAAAAGVSALAGLAPEGTVTIAGQVGTTVAASAGPFGTVTVAAQSALTIAGTRILGGQFQVDPIIGLCTLSAAATMTWGGAVTIAAQGGLVVNGHLQPFGTLTIAAASTVSVDGALEAGPAVTIDASATITVAAGPRVKGALTIAAQSAVSVYAVLSYTPSFALVGSDRWLSWTAPGMVYVLFDGDVVATTDQEGLLIPPSIDARRYVDVWDSLPATPRTPGDEIDLAWTDVLTRGGTYTIYQRSSGGSAWTEVRSTPSPEWRVGPFEDGAWQFYIDAEDPEEDTNQSLIESFAIDSAPRKVSGLSSSWDATTQTWTLAWTASPSADLDGYSVYSSEGAAAVALDGSPYTTLASSAVQWQRAFTTETGIYVVLVRAYDTSGKEDGNTTQAAVLVLIAGVAIRQPAEPENVRAEPSAGGKVTVTWTYRPGMETGVGSGGAAYFASVYSDSGTGTIDFATALGTVAMGYPTETASYTWTSGVLSDDVEYKFVVRIRGADASIETRNTAEVSAVPNSDVPGAIALAGTVR